MKVELSKDWKRLRKSKAMKKIIVNDIRENTFDAALCFAYRDVKKPHKINSLQQDKTRKRLHVIKRYKCGEIQHLKLGFVFFFFPCKAEDITCSCELPHDQTCHFEATEMIKRKRERGKDVSKHWWVESWRNHYKNCSESKWLEKIFYLLSWELRCGKVSVRLVEKLNYDAILGNDFLDGSDLNLKEKNMTFDKYKMKFEAYYNYEKNVSVINDDYTLLVQTDSVKRWW